MKAYSATEIAEAYRRMVTWYRENPDAVLSHEDADAMSVSERAAADAEHLLAYLHGNEDCLAPDGREPVAL